MKKRRNIIAALTLCAVLSFTACGGNTGTGNTLEENNPTQTADSVTESKGNEDDLEAQLTDLYNQEQQVFDEHKELWDKVFNSMDKSSQTENADYADFLAGAVENIKDSLSAEELDTLTNDIEVIRGLEKDIMEIQDKLSATDSSAASDSGADTDSSAFKNISGTDFDGNKIDESLFSDNAVTVLNFWFSGCKPCVAELSKLNELNEAIKSMGGQVIGVNTETFDGNETAIEEAKSILESQGAEYRNVCFDSDSDAAKYASNIMAFPTTILVDRNGNIVGEPMLGGIDQQENYDQLMEQIQSVIDADNAK